LTTGITETFNFLVAPAVFGRPPKSVSDAAGQSKSVSGAAGQCDLIQSTMGATT
jgi:hypothetical protein